MIESAEHFGLKLTRKQLIGLYILLVESENALDSSQQEVYKQVSRDVYSILSVEELEDVDSYYSAL